MNAVRSEAQFRQLDELNPEHYVSLADAFQHACNQYREQHAYHCLGAPLSFEELDRKSRDFAAWLSQVAGLEYGDRIAIQLPNLTQYPIAAWGALRAGLVLVNTNPLYTERELLHQFNDSGARALVVLADLLPLIERVVPHTGIETVITTAPADLLWAEPAPGSSLLKVASLAEALESGASLELPVVVTNMDDIAVLQYTGGTTGKPKGAVLTHANLFAAARQSTLAFVRDRNEAEVLIAPMPLYHVYGFGVNVISSVLHGRQSVLIPDPRDLDSLVSAMRQFRMTGMAGINTLFASLMQHPDFDRIDFSRADSIVAGGTTLVDDVARAWSARTGTTIYEGYGLSETSAAATVNPRHACRVGTVGKAMPSVELKVVGDDGGELPPGTAGELLVRGPNVMCGYWRRPDATAEVLDDDGWLRTGDVAEIDRDGYVRIVDRIKDMILVSGFNVYPNEIEEVAYGHPLIVECAAVGVVDARSGEAVKLFVVSADQRLSADDVQAYCRERLTNYKVPRQIEFRSDLPKSNVGKILRRELRDAERDCAG